MMLPLGIVESTHLIQALDQPLLAGFANLNHSHQEILQKLGHIYRDTPFGTQLAAGMDDLINGVFQPATFTLLAAARAAIQGSQHDRLVRHIRDELGRPAPLTTVNPPEAFQALPPLLASTRHWLMDVVVMGFSRLDPAMIGAFSSTLDQLQADPAFLRTTAVVAGFMNELLLQPEEVPLFRWCDLWSRAMLTTLSASAPPALQRTNGTLYPLGIDWRQHATMVSFVVYGVLETGDSAELVTITRSAYKVAAIQQDQLWLLFPEAGLLLESLSTGKALQLHDMPLATGGHLLWDEQAATLGNGYSAMDLAVAYFAPNANRPITQWEVSAEQRHPIHVAEPIALAGYAVNERQTEHVICAGEQSFKLDLRHTTGTELTIEAIGGAQRLFGLMRFDAGEWVIQPLYVSPKKGKSTFIGFESAKVLKKAPKDNAVGILKERASRLLREKS